MARPGRSEDTSVPIWLKLSAADSAKMDQVLARPEFEGWTKGEWCLEIIQTALRYYTRPRSAGEPGRKRAPTPAAAETAPPPAEATPPPAEATSPPAGLGSPSAEATPLPAEAGPPTEPTPPPTESKPRPAAAVPRTAEPKPRPAEAGPPPTRPAP